MRPKQLRYPFMEGVAPYVFIRDRVWFVPKENPGGYSFPGWEDAEIFGNSHPVRVEYCSGNGAWIAERAAREPEINWVAVEKKFDRVRKIWSKINNYQLRNLIVIYGEALQVTADYFPSGSLSSVYVNFPDPWPKRHHARHRLFVPPFLEEIKRCLQVGGAITIATDHLAYSESMLALFNQFESFSSRLPEPYYTHEMADYGTSYFEDLWRSQGSEIRYLQFEKVVAS